MAAFFVYNCGNNSFPMKRKHEIHGNLARLLATENLDIQHAAVETASFNVENRTLTLPIWEKASDEVYQLLLSHECGHAIYTPNTDWTELTSVPMDFLNVTEDVRIEKLMKRRYPGLKKTFYNGYKELNDEDFFLISNNDVSEYNLADRINLHFKIGNFISINFNEKEQQLVDEIGEAETFLDAILCAEKLYEYCKDMEHQTMIDSISFSDSSGSPASSSGFGGQASGQQLEVDGNAEKEGEENSDGSSTTNSDVKQNKNNEGSNHHDPSSNSGYIKTASSLQQAINRLNSFHSTGICYVTVPELDMDRIVVGPKEIHSLCKNEWKNYSTKDFILVDTDYMNFKSLSKKEVAYLVKEFECKKAADSYSRASESKTGILDCGSLHSYKFNDDIFKKVVTVTEGKNHGLIFILDWSGSMDNIILDTCRQLFKLIWFCKKVSIPFEVYAFTNSWQYSNVIKNNKVNEIVIDGSFNLLNIISSNVNSATLELHMKNLYRLEYSHHHSNYCQYSTPNKLNLSGTPLNESLITLHKIIPHFQSKTKVQKVQCVVLTDGEASALARYTGIMGGYSGIGDECYLKDNKLKTTYRFPKYSYYATHKFTDVLLRHLKDVFPSVSFIGIRLLTAGEITNFVKNHLENNNDSESYNKIINDWKKDKSCVVKCAGYDSYFGIYSKALNSSIEFEVEESDSVSAIRNAFKKSLESKKMNRKILSQFADLIA